MTVIGEVRDRTRECRHSAGQRSGPLGRPRRALSGGHRQGRGTRRHQNRTGSPRRSGFIKCVHFSTVTDTVAAQAHLRTACTLTHTGSLPGRSSSAWSGADCGCSGDGRRSGAAPRTRSRARTECSCAVEVALGFVGCMRFPPSSVGHGGWRLGLQSSDRAGPLPGVVLCVNEPQHKIVSVGKVGNREVVRLNGLPEQSRENGTFPGGVP